MRTLFYFSGVPWTGSARAFAIAARGLAAHGEPVTVACRADSPAEQGFVQAGLDTVSLTPGGSVGGDAWRLRAVLKEKFIEVVFLHTEREHLVASSAMRLAERGAVIRRVPAGHTPTRGRGGRVANRMATSRFLFATESDRARTSGAERAFIAPLGVGLPKDADAHAAARRLLGIDDRTQLIVCVADQMSRPRVTTALRTLALLADRHRDLRLALVGPAGNDEDTHMHASALGVTSLVRFFGKDDDVATVVSAADVGWVAAEGDDGAFGCLDFMAAGVPIIAERSAVLAHYAPDGIAGLLLPPADPSDTAAAVARFLSDGAQRDAMGDAGRTRARRDFAEDAMVAGFGRAAAAAGDRALWTAK